MIPYLIVAFIFIFLSVAAKRIKGIGEVLLLIYVAIFLCSGYMCGSDWRGYELDYQENLNTIDILLEPGYYFISLIFRRIGFNFWMFCILLKFTCLFVTYKVFLKYIKDDKYIAMLFFFSFYGIYLFIDAPLRNLCAITLFLLSLLVYDKSKTKAYVLCASGLLFHSSAIIGVLFYIFKNIKINSYVYLSLYIIALYISFQGTLIAEVANNSVVGQLLFAEKLERYVENGFGAESTVSSATSMGEMLRTFFFFLVFFSRKKLEQLENGKEIFYGTMFFFILGKIGASMEVLMRFSCFFAIFYAISMTNLIRIFAVSFRQIYKIAIVSLALMQTIATITFDYRFVPYTNYFSYLFFHDEMPSYSVRYNYNYHNSPYNNKK